MPSSPRQNYDGPSGLPYILLAVAYFFVGLFFSRSHHSQEQESTIHHCDETECQDRQQEISGNVTVSYAEDVARERHSESNEQHRIQRSIRNATWAAFIAAAVYGLISLGIFNEMRTTNAQQLTAFRVDERAWVGIEPFKPKFKTPAGGKFTALYTYDLSLRNSGKTAARCVQVRLPRSASLTDLSFFDHPDWVANLQDNFLLGRFKGGNDIPIERSFPRTIAPGQVAPIPFDIYGATPRVWPSGNESVQSFVGRIDYADDFGVRHWVKFCMFIEGSDGSLGYCKYGNDEDHTPEEPPTTPPSCPITANPA